MIERVHARAVRRLGAVWVFTGNHQESYGCSRLITPRFGTEKKESFGFFTYDK